MFAPDPINLFSIEATLSWSLRPVPWLLLLLLLLLLPLLRPLLPLGGFLVGLLLGAPPPLRTLPLPFPFADASTRGWKALQPGAGSGTQPPREHGVGWAYLQPLALLLQLLPFQTWLQTRGRHLEDEASVDSLVELPSTFSPLACPRLLPSPLLLLLLPLELPVVSVVAPPLTTPHMPWRIAR